MDMQNLSDAELERIVGSSQNTRQPAPSKPGSPIDFTSLSDSDLEAMVRGAPSSDDGFDLSESIGKAAKFTKDLVTGDDRREFNYPEIDLGFRRSAKLSLSRGDLGKLDMILKDNPDVPHGIDKYGNAWVQNPESGESFYLNEPGVSGQDVYDFTSAAVFDAPLALRGGKLGQKMAGGFGRVAGTGAGAGAGSVLQDAAATMAGSKQGLDPEAALMTAAFGAGFEMVSPLVAPFVRKLFRDKAMFDGENLTRAGRRAMTKAGLDPDAVTPEFIEEFNRLARDASSPEEMQRAARLAGGHAEGIRLSEGDVGQDVLQQAREDAALKGAYGEKPQNVMDGFREGQIEDITSARERHQEAIGGGADVRDPYQGMAEVQDRLKSDATRLKKDIRTAYDAAKELEATTPTKGFLEFGKTLRKEIEDDFATESLSSVKELLGYFDKLAITKGKTRQFSVNQMEKYRVRINNAYRGAVKTDPTSAAALNQMRKRFDEFFDHLVDDALIEGDDTAIEAFKKARGLRREYAKRFEGNRIIERLIGEIDEGGEAFLALEPSEATRLLFGASQFGNKQGTTAAIRRLNNVLGKDSEDWHALREEAFIRLFPDEPKEIGKFRGNFDRAMKTAPELMKELFTKDEIKKLRQFRNAVSTARDRKPGAVNHSNTGITVSRILQDVFGPAARIIDVAARRFGRPFVEASRARDASMATAPKGTPKIGLRPGVAGAAGATGYETMP